MTGYPLTALLCASLAAAACRDAGDDGAELPPPWVTTGGDDTTFDHDNSQTSILELIDRLAREGPSSFTSRMHPCPKPRYATLGNILRSVGVDIDRTTEFSAGALYRAGERAMGAPDYANRIRENLQVTTSAAARIFDVFVAAADEIIAAVPSLARCRVGGVAAQLFNGAQCVPQGITCIIGVPAQPAHVEQCNETVSDAGVNDQANGKRIAVAALMAAAHTCE